MILDEIQAALRRDAYQLSQHGIQEMLADDLERPDIVDATLGGELIEDYPNAYPFPACLLLGPLAGDSPLHLVWAIDRSRGYAVLVTTYRPDPAKWSADFRRRVKP